MKAIVHERYGPPAVLELHEVRRPRIGAKDVLVLVRAAGVSYPDAVLTRGVPYAVRLVAGLHRPRHRVRGLEIAGTVVEVGANVTGLRPGDDVFGWCGRSGKTGGGFAEFARCPQDLLIRKPPAMSFEQAASLPTSGVTALQAVRDWACVRSGQRVLVNGASGGVGAFAVQIAAALGAHVTGVCSAANADFVRSIGAEAVIDYTHEDFTHGARRYDAVIDVAHFADRPLRDCLRVLTPRGALVPASNTRNRWIGGLSRVLRARLIAPFTSRRIRAPEMRRSRADLAALAALVSAGQVRAPVERTYRLAEVPEAIRRFEAGHTRGKIVITPAA